MPRLADSGLPGWKSGARGRSSSPPSRSCVPRLPWKESSTTPDSVEARRFFIVTHPFHPLHGRRFELVDYRRTWSEHRVYFHDQHRRLRAMPAGWTDAGAPDPFVVLAAGRAHFRMEDLVQLAALVGRRKA
ncbi:MAG TPA: DUF5372 family protein [Gemmatimonadales bacterium]|nr:DUF5372 family protein [Gemmatimonadales bacterium]